MSTWTDQLKSMMLQTTSAMNQAKSRLWNARDEVAVLETKLAIARRSLAEAERDHAETLQLLTENWGFFRSEFERVSSEPAPTSLTVDVDALMEPESSR